MSDKLTSACYCVGPQNGQPLCPCQMRGVTIEDGRYVRRQDLGPVPDKEKAAAIKRGWASLISDAPPQEDKQP